MGRIRPKRSRLLRKSPPMRRFHLRNPWIRPLMVFNYAALLIQKVFRSHLSRRRHARPGNALDIPQKKQKLRKKVAANHQLDRYLAKLDYYKITGTRKPEWMDGGFSTWCAVQVQSAWRMYRCVRRDIRRKMMIFQIAALTIQNTWRYYRFTQECNRPTVPTVSVHLNPGRFLEKSSAALAIQRQWRGFCAKRIFKYFSDLIRFKLKGAPGDLLRSIVPGEADFMDKAAGVHVRFRLGGSTFPPNIYFKIYTHRPLCDVNAFAPRDYNTEKTDILKDPKYRFEKCPPRRKKGPMGNDGKQNIRVGSKYFGTRVTTTVGIDQWYKRDENNPWRPIASQVFNEVLTPPWLKDDVPSIKKVVPFHFSRLRRQTDIDKSKLQRKREWMMKAYSMAKQAMDDAEEVAATEGALGHHHGWGAESKQYHPQMPSVPSGGHHSSSSHPNNQYEYKRADYYEYKDGRNAGEKSGGSVEGRGNDYNHDNDRHFADEKYSDPISPLHAPSPPKPRHAQFQLPTDAKATKVEDDTDLLKWTMTLDYDEYAKDWRQLATSMPSDADRKKLYSLAAGLDIGTY